MQLIINKQELTTNLPINGIFEGLMGHFRGGRLVVVTTLSLAFLLKAVERQQIIVYPYLINGFRLNV